MGERRGQLDESVRELFGGLRRASSNNLTQSSALRSSVFHRVTGLRNFPVIVAGSTVYESMINTGSASSGLQTDHLKLGSWIITEEQRI